jgi:hypothetical protein
MSQNKISYRKALKITVFVYVVWFKKGGGVRTAYIVISGKADLVTKLILVPGVLDPVGCGGSPDYPSESSPFICIIPPS